MRILGRIEVNLPGGAFSACRNILAGVLTLVSFTFSTEAQELDAEKFAAASLKYRTALYYEPLLPLPLDALVKLYAEREDELIGLYRSHIEEYPDDAGAKTVLIRLLQKLKRPGAGELISTSVARHPEFADLQYLLFQFLRGRGDTRAVEALSRAIDLEDTAARKYEWLEELLQMSEGVEARAAASLQLKKLLEIEDQAGPNLLASAKLMQRYEFWDLSVEALMKIPAGSLEPEGVVSRSILRAKAELQKGNAKAAAAMLDALLTKLSADHWRRREVMNLRFSVVASDEERNALLAKFRQIFEENPKNEAALLDYIDLLIASDLQTTASGLLVKYASELPETELVEGRALALLDSLQDPVSIEKFLSTRLELFPERADLRFRLVKALYALKRDADAAQEFQTVIAGQEADGVSNLILELQRYLRSIQRIEAAVIYLERFVEQNPERLSIARELAEVYMSLEKERDIEILVPKLVVEGTSVERVLDLSEFLLENGFLVQAKQVLSKSLATGGENFSTGLLLVNVLGEIGDVVNGDRLISDLRKLADTPERYAQWLEQAVVANVKFESLDRFFEIERGRFSFTDGEWPADRVEKFVMLCEIGLQRRLADRVLLMVREQLESGSFDSSLRIRLRRLLVGVLQSDPKSMAEVEEQLKLLIKEDPEAQTRYELQLALAYHRGSRVDLAQDLLLGLDLASVNDVGMVQEAVEVLLSYRYFSEAERALAAVNRLAPSDLFSWEKRLTLLALLKQENEFRALIRNLRNGEQGEGLRSESLSALDRHMIASHWRSVSRLFSSGSAQRFEEILPLLASVERETRIPSDSAWTEWSRAMVLQALGRMEEAEAAQERLEGLLDKLESEEIVFPGGLVLSREGARRFLIRNQEAVEIKEEQDIDFLLSAPKMQWGYEIDAGSRIERFGWSSGQIVYLDNRGRLGAIASATGKLLWKKNVDQLFLKEKPAGIAGRPSLFVDLPGSDRASLAASAEAPQVKMTRDWILGEDRVAILSGNQLLAFQTGGGELLWTANLPLPEAGVSSDPTFSKSGIVMKKDANRVYVFHPDSGKIAAVDWISGRLLWESHLGSMSESSFAEKTHSLNSGLDTDNGLVFAYGREASVLDGATGSPLWNFSDKVTLTFPVLLRKNRTLESTEEVTLKEPDSETGIESWQRGAEAGGESQRPTRILNFLRLADNGIGTDTLFREDAALLGPASFWSATRTEGSNDALGQISDGYLWLMSDQAVGRVSIRFPVASRSLSGEGVFLGQQGNHAWFLRGQALQHLDFFHDRRKAIEFEQIGGEPLRAAFLGNHLVVRGERGIRVMNTRSGNVIGTTILPERATEYLASHRVGDASDPVRYFWQGIARVNSDGSPSYCQPVTDVVRDGMYVTQFHDNLLVCLGSSEKDLEDLAKDSISNPTPPE